MRKNNLFKIAAFATAIITLFAGVSPVMAKNTYTPVQGVDVDFENYLIYDSDAITPDINFNFTIAPGTALSANSPKVAVFAGDDASVSGQPVLVNKADSTKGAVSHFDASSTPYDEAQAIESTLGKHANLTNDPITLDANKVYSRDPVTVDFSDVTFSEPGVFRWVITEQADTDGSLAAAGITIDSNTVRYLDVYVVGDGFEADSQIAGKGTGSLRVEGAVLHSVADFQPTSAITPTEPEASNANTKAIGFTNILETVDLTISKQVAGNQGSINKYFEFTLEFEGPANSKYAVDGALDPTVVIDNNNTTTPSSYNGKVNAAYIETDSNGEATVKYYLQHNQDLTIHGLPKGTISVDVTETETDYTPTYQITAGQAQGQVVSSNAASIENPQVDTTVAYTNTKSGTIPTGIISTILPGAMTLIIGLGGAMLIKSKNK